MALSKPAQDPYTIVAELLRLDPVDSRTLLTPADFEAMVDEFESRIHKVTSLCREVDWLTRQAIEPEA